MSAEGEIGESDRDALYTACVDNTEAQFFGAPEPGKLYGENMPRSMMLALIDADSQLAFNLLRIFSVRQTILVIGVTLTVSGQGDFLLRDYYHILISLGWFSANICQILVLVLNVGAVMGSGTIG